MCTCAREPTSTGGLRRSAARLRRRTPTLKCLPLPLSPPLPLFFTVFFFSTSSRRDFDQSGSRRRTANEHKLDISASKREKVEGTICHVEQGIFGLRMKHVLLFERSYEKNRFDSVFFWLIIRKKSRYIVYFNLPRVFDGLHCGSAQSFHSHFGHKIRK